jgi:hypothetical protein
MELPRLIEINDFVESRAAEVIDNLFYDYDV